jgi:hypothetical protein
LALGNLSPATIAAYARIARMFSDWHIAQYGHMPDMSSLHDDVIDRYVRWCALRLSATTCRKRRAALHWARAAGAHAREST